jgi:hypothetical protein
MLACQSFELGKRYTDKVSGFSGIATGFVQYITGCNRVLLQPKTKNGEYKEALWFDAQRLKTEQGESISLDNSKNPGFDKQAPIR